jgi:hypothetical protein
VKVILRELRQLAAEIDRQRATVAKAIAVAEQLFVKVAAPIAARPTPKARAASSS